MTKKNHDFDRRTLLKTSVAAGIGGSWGALVGSAAVQGSSNESAAVETSSGKVRGIVNNGVQAFRGIPYGAPTGGRNRFMPPQKPEPWTGVREAFYYGHTAPQVQPTPAAHANALRSGALEGEDCLVLNVYAPFASDGRKRPVMLWLHGGGYAYGSASSVGHDGTNLARSGDVVAVGINHRLNVFGYLYLAEAGGKAYADSGNAGMLDIVAALQWVHDIIQHFGGDPGKVTIFGQSGGGGKVSTLMAMPSAKREPQLFRNSIVDSLQRRAPFHHGDRPNMGVGKRS